MHYKVIILTINLPDRHPPASSGRVRHKSDVRDRRKKTSILDASVLYTQFIHPARWMNELSVVDFCQGLMCRQGWSNKADERTVLSGKQSASSMIIPIFAGKQQAGLPLTFRGERKVRATQSTMLPNGKPFVRAE